MKYFSTYIAEAATAAHVQNHPDINNNAFRTHAANVMAQRNAARAKKKSPSGSALVPTGAQPKPAGQLVKPVTSQPITGGPIKPPSPVKPITGGPAKPPSKPPFNKPPIGSRLASSIAKQVAGKARAHGFDTEHERIQKKEIAGLKGAGAGEASRKL